jgi:hypothetical protein
VKPERLADHVEFLVGGPVQIDPEEAIRGEALLDRFAVEREWRGAVVVDQVAARLGLAGREW